ncbi:glycosyltransferase family 2 protein [Rhodobacteraceae bacterium N5(2021)]|uniref:Glycosyltransferase family 2 protein n=1 Tax=Gymnodinialimonas phycosphaerae TaxID=2841589 RepID=A0A975TTR0_9RHOB|nr:glycosyltransferase family 2 protein [Gymnodinialimonas phycosphaerae]MBY4894887.1 glycosyltransferase family 2 protein [Gymnodinialimonas phycosphaerae]
MSKPQPKRTPTWGIVATIAEPAPLVLAFVAHHLALGAREIRLYFDDPYDPAADTLDWIPPAHVTRCDRVYWATAAPRRPRRQNNRQSINATRAQARCNVDFLLSCDADEFLRPGSDVALQLSEIPEAATWMKVFNLERTTIKSARQTTIFDGVFKVHYQGREDTPLRTSELAPFGFTGHAAGKPFVRTRIGMNIGIHVPRHGHIKDRVVPPHYPADQIELAHFDGLTPLHWAAKFVRQAANSPEFLAQLPPLPHRAMARDPWLCERCGRTTRALRAAHRISPNRDRGAGRQRPYHKGSI